MIRHLSGSDDRSVTTSTRKEWLAPAGLIGLSLIPIIFGGIRATELLSGPEITPDNARFVAAPVPILVHIVSATLYSLLGAIQFVPSLRKHRRRWHRFSGRLLVPCGIAVAATGLWMTLLHELPATDGGLLNAFRFVFASGMLISIVLGFLAVRRRDFAQHRAWMMRAYAIGLGAGTQVFTFFTWLLIAGEPGVTARALVMAAGWIINLAVAEWVIHRGRQPQAHRTKQRDLATT